MIRKKLNRKCAVWGWLLRLVRLVVFREKMASVCGPCPVQLVMEIGMVVDDTGYPITVLWTTSTGEIYPLGIENQDVIKQGEEVKIILLKQSYQMSPSFLLPEKDGSPFAVPDSQGEGNLPGGHLN